MEVDIKHNIAQNIRNFRKAKGLTQKQLGYYPKYQRILIDFTAFFQFCGNRVVTEHKKRAPVARGWETTGARGRSEKE